VCGGYATRTKLLQDTPQVDSIYHSTPKNATAEHSRRLSKSSPHALYKDETCNARKASFYNDNIGLRRYLCGAAQFTRMEEDQRSKTMTPD
jgi:hypothetical protein